MTRNYHTTEHYELAYEWWQELDEGQPSRYLAKILGVTFAVVLQWRRKGREPYHSQIRLPVRTIERMRELLDDGASHAEIARTLGINRKTVESYFPGTGWTLEQRMDYLKMQREIARL